MYPYHRRLLRNKREQNIDTYNRIDEPQKNYAVQKKKKKKRPKNVFSVIAIYVKF